MERTVGKAVLKPRRIRRGDAVSLVAPSGSASDAARVAASARALESLGFVVRLSPHCADVRGYLAGADSIRAGELGRAFADPDTTAVICLKGGYGTPRILDAIDYSTVAKNPKVFLGYSDITGLHTAFNQIAGLVTFHGPMPSSDMVPEFDQGSRASLENVFFKLTRDDWSRAEFPNPSGAPVKTLSGGIAEGCLVGGNLSLLAATMGTPWEIDTAGKILFLEDIDEAPYRIDRMLNQLRLAGKFSACAGIILGGWTRCTPSEGKRSLSLEEVFFDLIVPSGKPVIAGVEAGHVSPTLTLPFGIRYRLDADAGKIEALESPFAE